MLDISTMEEDRRGEIECERVTRTVTCGGIGLTPQILRTCRAVHQEAGPILYGRNVFGFPLWNLRSAWHLELQRQDWRIEAETFCRDIYQNPEKHWNENEKFLQALGILGFTSFVQQIGQQNTVSMKRLRFDHYLGFSTGLSWTTKAAQEATQCYGWAIEVITLLLKYHFSGIQQIKFCHGFYTAPIHWDGFENGPFEPIESDHLHAFNLQNQLDKYSSGERLLGAWQREIICKAIESMIEEVHWLQCLRITGLHDYDRICQRVEDLQTLVKSRH